MLAGKLIDKAKEAFLLAIEVYNKPTIRYRVEGFSFFICNAWELMLKAYMIKQFGESSIYYKNNPNRTLSLENCIEKVFTNNKDPLRRNLEKIIELRNTSTHFIVEEYEMVYIPLFQSAVFNFMDKMKSFHNVDLSTLIPRNFLTLAISFSALDMDEVRTIYPKEIADKLVGFYESLYPLIEENSDRFAIRVDHRYYLTKDKSSAATTVLITGDAETGVKIVKDIKDPNTSHKFTMKKCCVEIQRRLDKLNIGLDFNKYHFNLFCKYYNIKENEKLCYVSRIFAQPQYSYSVHAIEFIVEEIRKDPENIVENLKKRQKK